MSLTVDAYKNLPSSEQKQAMKEIQSKLSTMINTMDGQFDEYVNDKIPNKIMSLNKLSHTVPTLFKESEPIKVNILKASNQTRPPRKKRKLASNKMDIDDEGSNEAKGKNEGIWFKKTVRTKAELARLETSVDMNGSINLISNLITKEVIEMIHITTTLKMNISLKMPAIQEGNNFGVEIQEDVVDDLSRAENGALDAIDQIANYHQIRSKAISKILKWPKIGDYRYAMRQFDNSHLATLKSMTIDLRNSYIILHDTITKNLEKLKKPREESSRFYLY